MLRKIIRIDEDKCDGCGLCIPECKEGAIRVIEGKARLTGDFLCDGLGACIGYCPRDAITIEEREAEAYNEVTVIKNIGMNMPVLTAHLKHLIAHNEYELLNQAAEYLKLNNIPSLPENLAENESMKPSGNILKHETKEKLSFRQGNNINKGLCGCPGTISFEKDREHRGSFSGIEKILPSELRQWPIQLHLVRPEANYFQREKLIIVSSCSPAAFGNIQEEYIKGNSIVMACPKLDYTEPYLDKLTQIFRCGKMKKVIVLIMEVPCCKGLTKISVEAARLSGRHDLYIEEHTINIEGQLNSSRSLSDMMSPT